MSTAARFLPVLALAASLRTASGASALANARCAQRLLGPDVWSRVLRIENANPAGRYPRTVDALVFELGDVLWFYTDTDGTQSLSQYRHRAEADKAELGPLLTAIDPGFVSWADAPPDDRAAAAPRRPRNGCFIECLALRRMRLQTGAETEEPRLLSYYVALPGGLRGHTVLQFRERGVWRILDPDNPKRCLRLRTTRPGDPGACANALRPDVANARSWPLADAPFGVATHPSTRTNACIANL